jgi:hypothetical protein
MLLRLTTVCLTTLSLTLGGCAMDGMGNSVAPASSAPAQSGSSLQNLPVFLNKLDSARGSALSIADRAAVGGIAAETKSVLDNTQNAFIDRVGAATGLGGDALRLIVPSATTPVSDSKLVNGLQAKLGKKLPTADAKVITAANALRNSSLSALKDGFADKVGNVTGVGKDTVTALMPLLGL